MKVGNYFGMYSFTLLLNELLFFFFFYLTIMLCLIHCSLCMIGFVEKEQ